MRTHNEQVERGWGRFNAGDRVNGAAVLTGVPGTPR
jgi:hypothetical protein